jgi:kynurenine formamidase
MPRFIDLSASIAPSPEGTPAVLSTDISYVTHNEGADQIEGMFGVPSELLCRDEGWAIEIFSNFGTHNSTHVDAPWHYNSKIGGERANTIDEMPLEWFFGPGVVLDMTHKQDGEAMTVADAVAALEKADHELASRDIVLVRTGCDCYYSHADYMARGCGVTGEATKWLYDRGVRVMGIDAWGWDRPLHLQAKDAIDKMEKGVFWEAHQLDLDYCQIERLCNLDQLPLTGFTVSCFPLKVKKGSAGPTRAVAMVNE